MPVQYYIEWNWSDISDLSLRIACSFIMKAIQQNSASSSNSMRNWLVSGCPYTAYNQKCCQGSSVHRPSQNCRRRECTQVKDNCCGEMENMFFQPEQQIHFTDLHSAYVCLCACVIPSVRSFR